MTRWSPPTLSESIAPAIVGAGNFVMGIGNAYFGQWGWATLGFSFATFVALDMKTLGGVRGLWWRARFAQMLIDRCHWPFVDAWDYAAQCWQFEYENGDEGEPMRSPADALASDIEHWEL